jgi:phage shock protein A
MPITDPGQYKGKKIAAFPYDKNGRASSVLVLPIVDGGTILGYLPAAAVDAGNGTAKLKVDTELTLNADTVNIGNLKVGSTDGIQSDTFLLTDPDGTVHVSMAAAPLTDVNVEKWGGTAQTGADLTPLFQHLDVDLSTVATEATLSDVKTDLDSILAALDVALSTRASESTLSDIKDELDTVEAKLQSIIDNTDTLEVNTDELESKLEDIKTKLDSLIAKDYATETTLASVLTSVDDVEAKLEDIKSKLDTLNATDFATETTLASILSAVDEIEPKLDTLIAKDYATETTLGTLALESGGNLDAIKSDLDTLAAVDFATQTTLAALKNQINDVIDADFNVRVQEARVGAAYPAAISVDDSVAPATLLLSADASRKEYIIVHEDSTNTLYVGFDPSVTVATGIPIVGNQLFGSDKYYGFVYAVAPTGVTIDVRVVEVR